MAGSPGTGHSQIAGFASAHGRCAGGST